MRYIRKTPRTLVGSSRKIRAVEMYSSRSVNQPLGRNHVRVCVGEDGIIKNVAIPTVKVMRPLSRVGQCRCQGMAMVELTYSTKKSQLVDGCP